MFPGYIILATLLVNPSNQPITLETSQLVSYPINSSVISNYDLRYTSLGIEDAEMSSTANLKFEFSNSPTSGKFEHYSGPVSTADEVVLAAALQSSGSLYNTMQIGLNNTTGPIDFNFSKIYLLAKDNQSGGLADDIIDGVSAGLGLMSPITNEFLNGFSALFWDSTANSGKGALTTFGNFALIFMGVSITFAVVKLALNLIRGKTGA